MDSPHDVHDPRLPRDLPDRDALVTGDAVVLDVSLVHLPTRAVSVCIDLALQLTALVVLIRVVAAAGLGTAASSAVIVVVLAVVVVGYPMTTETLTRGRTVGKLALGLRVVRDDGGPERLRQALVRALFAVVEIWLTLGVIAVVASLLSRRGKRLGDTFAGTVVVRERVPSAGWGPVLMPPPLAGWAASADLARVPDALALAARQLLLRWPDLDPVTARDMAVRLATDVGRYVAPPSPPGTPPEAYLAAVVVERSRRERLRLMPPPVVAPAAVAAAAPGAAHPTPQPAAQPTLQPSAPPPTEAGAPGGYALPG